MVPQVVLYLTMQNISDNNLTISKGENNLLIEQNNFVNTMYLIECTEIILPCDGSIQSDCISTILICISVPVYPFQNIWNIYLSFHKLQCQNIVICGKYFLYNLCQQPNIVKSKIFQWQHHVHKYGTCVPRSVQIFMKEILQ